MKNKYKMLVLSDLNETTSSTIKSSISFAKIIKADINFFYVKKPTEVIEKESQLSAMRTINKEYFSIDKKIKTVEIIPGKGSGQLKKKVIRFLQQGHIKNKYHRIDKDSKNFGRIFVYFKF